MDDKNLTNPAANDGAEPVDGGTNGPQLPGISNGETYPHPLVSNGVGSSGPASLGGPNDPTISVGPGGAEPDFPPGSIPAPTTGNGPGSSREGGGGAPASLGNAYSPMATPPGGGTAPNSDPSQWYIGPQHRGPSPPLRIGGAYGSDGLPSIGGDTGANPGGFVAGPNAAGGNSGGGSSGGDVTLGISSSGQVNPGAGAGQTVGGTSWTGSIEPTGPPDRMPGGQPPTSGGTELGLHPMPPTTMPGGPTTLGGGGLLNPIDPLDMHHPGSPGPTGPPDRMPGPGGDGAGGGVVTPGTPGNTTGFENGFPGGQIASADGDMFGPSHHAA